MKDFDNFSDLDDGPELKYCTNEDVDPENVDADDDKDGADDDKDTAGDDKDTAIGDRSTPPEEDSMGKDVEEAVEVVKVSYQNLSWKQYFSLDALILETYLPIMKINNFRGDLRNASVKYHALVTLSAARSK